MRYLFAFLVAVPALGVAVSSDSRASDLTLKTCQDDRQAMYDAAERNRVKSIGELESELRFTTDDDRAATINQQINEAWDEEEMFRNLAAIAYRDCEKFVKAGG